MSAYRKALSVAVAVLGMCGTLRASDCLGWRAGVGTGPPACSYAGMAYDSARLRSVWVGGFGQSPGFQVWEWNGAAWLDKTAGAPPLFGRIPGFVYDAARGVCVLFTFDAKTYEYNGTTWVDRNIAGPSARFSTYMAYDSARGQTVLFGGGGGASPLSDTWTYDGTSWTQRSPATSPSARTAGTMAFDSARGVVVLHGGFVGSTQNATNETWEWDGTTWSLRSVEGPTRFGHRTVYDAQAGMTVVLDGYSASAAQTLDREVWGWDGVRWRYLGQSQDPFYSPQIYGASAYDSARGEILLRQASQPTPETSRTYMVDSAVPGVQRQPADVVVEEGCTIAVGVTASSTTPLTHQWRKNGAPLPGATSAMLTIANGAAGDTGEYDCVLTSGCGETVTRKAFVTVLPRCPGDANRDGVRNFLDLNEVLSGFGQACPVAR